MHAPTWGTLSRTLKSSFSCSDDRAPLEAHQPRGDEPVVVLDEVGPPPCRSRGRDVAVGRGHAAVAGEVRCVRLPVIELEIERELLDRHVLEPELVVPRIEVRSEVHVVAVGRRDILDALRALGLRNARRVAGWREHEIAARIRHEAPTGGDGEVVAEPGPVVHHSADETRGTLVGHRAMALGSGPTEGNAVAELAADV